MQPMVKAIVTPQVAEAMKRFDTGRLQYEAFTDANPWMPGLAKAAEQARENRKPVASDNPFLAAQQTFSDQIVKLLESFRETTEKASEAMFLAIYGSPALQAAVGVDPESARPRRPAKSPMHQELLEKRIAELKSKITQGGLIECCIRGLLYAAAPRGAVDERGFEALRRIRMTEAGSRLSLAQYKAMVREQFFMLLLDTEATLAAIPKLLPEDVAERRKGLAAIRNVLSAASEISGETAERLKRVVSLFGVNEAEPSGTGAESVPFVTGGGSGKFKKPLRQ
jgi:hypothetical protein